ncbi:MAG: nitroreductase family protein [Actinobacteria bacterium]|nr:nitroreductase family protein [Actinomycetota bacterium]
MLESIRKAYLPPTQWPCVEVDEEKCDGCGRCVKTCPMEILRMRDGHPVEEHYFDAFRCIACDSCVAVCPTGAIERKGLYRVLEGKYRNTDVFPGETDTLPKPFGDDTPQRFEDYEDRLTETERVIFKRRSVRLFKKEQVPKEMVARVIESGRFAPSAGNCQPWSFVAIQDPEVIDDLCAKTERMLNLIVGLAFPSNREDFVRRPLHQKLLATVLGLRMPGNVDQRGAVGAKAVYEHSHHGLFLGAPTVILVLKDKRGIGQVDLDTALCVENMVLAAHSLGLATCLIGLMNIPIRFYPRYARKTLGIKPPFEFFTAIALGYPKGECDRAVKREPARIKWIV